MALKSETPEIKEKDEFTIIGIGVDTSIENGEHHKKIPPIWENFMNRLGEIKNIEIQNIHYGVSWPIGECEIHHIASVEVENAENVPEGMESKTIPKQKYAVFTHKGWTDTLDKTYYWLTLEWPKKTDLKQNENGIWFELYDERCTMDDKGEFDIWIPLKE